MKRKIATLVIIMFLSVAATAQPVKDAKYYYGVAMKQTDLNKVISNFSKAIELDPKYVDAIYYRGVAHFHNKNHSKALTDFTTVIRLDRKHFGALTYRGRTQESMKQPAQALKDYNDALSLNPKYGEGLYYRGLYFRKNEQQSKACADLKQAKALGYAVPAAELQGCK